MTLRHLATRNKLLAAAAAVLAFHATQAQVTPKATPNSPSSKPDRAAAYYHEGLATMYQEQAVTNGRPDFAAQAVEEYKLALNADPSSKYLQDGLAELYFTIGRIREAVTAAQDQVKKNPEDLRAHTLLGKVYLRSLNDMQGPQASEMLQLAIAEYETLARLKPKDVETHLLLGQLYGVNHDTAKAQAQFKFAQSLDANSEEAVLNMARLYSEQGQPQQAADALAAIPADDRSPRINKALGAAYDALKRYKLAAVAYRAALDEESDSAETRHALAAALLNDNQLAPALEIYQQILKADANDAESQIKISEIERRQGHYGEALVTLNKAKGMPGNADNLELEFNEAVLYDSLGKYDDAVATLQQVLQQTAHLDRKYSDPEKSNRALFLDRLAIVYNEQNKTTDALNIYKQMVELGNEYVIRGYQGEVDSYRDAHQYKESLNAASELAKLYPDDRSVQLMYAYQLAEAGKVDEGLALANTQLNHSATDKDTQVAIANIDLRLHRSADAMAHLDKAEALSTKPEDKQTVSLLRATILDRDKKYDEAEVEYRKILSVDPKNATVLNDLGYMLAEHGVRLQEALAMIKKAVEVDPQNGAFLDSLGWVYFKLAQYGPAEENLHQAIDRTPTDASIHDHLGELYEKTGRLQLAVTQWERSMSEYAHSLPADADPADVAKVKQKLDDARVKLARVSAVSGKKS